MGRLGRMHHKEGWVPCLVVGLWGVNPEQRVVGVGVGLGFGEVAVEAVDLVAEMVRWVGWERWVSWERWVDWGRWGGLAD